nr:retrotransposon protein, putative, Ty1-copia subclass [Tanacetum cinerariifolium]
TNDTTSQEVKKDVSSLRYIAPLNWAHDALLEFSLSKPQDHCSTEVPEGSGNTNPTASTSNTPADHMETLTLESPILAVSSPVPTAYSTDSQDSSSYPRLISKRVANQEETPSLDNILSLTNRFEDILREPKKIYDALQDPSWVEAMQEELLQFKIQKMDVKSAFLYGTIDEEVYVMQPDEV